MVSFLLTTLLRKQAFRRAFEVACAVVVFSVLVALIFSEGRFASSGKIMFLVRCDGPVAPGISVDILIHRAGSDESFQSRRPLESPETEETEFGAAYSVSGTIDFLGRHHVRSRTTYDAVIARFSSTDDRAAVEVEVPLPHGLAERVVHVVVPVPVEAR